jgi:hypothetical protein
MSIFITVIVMACSQSSVYAEGNHPELTDKASIEALQKTQALLKDPEARKKAAQANPQAAQAVQQLEALAGSKQNEQMMYELASDLFGDLTKEAKGDPNKMMELLQKAQKDPESYGKKLTPQQREQIRMLSGQIKH